MANKFVESHQTLGHPWPNDATHAVAYRTSTWPCGWDKEVTLRFFTSLEEMREFITGYVDWTLSEDNYFEFQAYEWDLGPYAMKSVDGEPVVEINGFLVAGYPAKARLVP